MGDIKAKGTLKARAESGEREEIKKMKGFPQEDFRNQNKKWKEKLKKKFIYQFAQKKLLTVH